MRRSDIFTRLPKGIFSTVSKNYMKHAFGVGDCLDVMKLMPKGSIDLIITDPPYNRSIDYGGVYKDNKKESDFIKYIEDRLEKSAQLLKESGSMYVVTYPEIAAELYLQLRSKVQFRRWLTWHYPTNIGTSRKNFTRSQRTILFFTKTSDYFFNRNKALMPYKNPTDKRVRALIKSGSKGRMTYDAIFRDDLIKFNLMKNIDRDRQKWHKCQLPFELLNLLIRVSSNKNGVILDPFAGTFSVSVVASKLNRNSIGIDINPEYRDLAIKRIKTDN